MNSAVDIEGTLKSLFGYDTFRPEQQAIIETSLADQDTLAILPTGGGKSLCYQLPALLREGLTVVVSPLIALMKDQVDQMEAAGVATTFLNSSINHSETQDRLAGLDAGKYKLLYLAPERLFIDGFLDSLKQWKLSAIAIDEAHCISEWGHQFRPEYRKLSQLRNYFPKVPFIALTATATERVRRDIVTQLTLEKPEVYVASFNRPNLRYSVLPKREPAQQVCDYVKRMGDVSGIVYCLAKKTTEEYASALQEIGVKALPYHAGLSSMERAHNQEAFIRDDVSVICATIAFGMGINKPNVRYVLHADLPKNIESYYQETGRAGRDGLPSECLLLYSGGDLRTLIFFIEQMEDEAAARIARQQLQQMADFAENTGCRRSTLLRYFGEESTVENCASCDNCLDDRRKEDVTQYAVKLIYCVDMIAKSGYPMGLKHAVDVLRGSKNAKLLQKGHDRLRAYAKGVEQSAAYWMALGKQLIQHGYFELPDDGYSTLQITPKAIKAVNKKETILLKLPVLQAIIEPKGKLSKSGSIECDTGLFQELRQLRKRLADAQGVPPYVIFGDVTLRLLARHYPDTEEAFLAISGVGRRRLADYGEVFMKVIADWLNEHEKQTYNSDEPTIEGKVPAPVKRPKKKGQESAAETLRLYRSGKSITEIAELRGFVESTIYGHLEKCISAGEIIAVDELITEQEQERILSAYRKLGEPDTLRPIYEELNEACDFGKIRLTLSLINVNDEPRSSPLT